MGAKLKAIKAELQRRKHHRTTAVGAWLRKVVQGYYQYHSARSAMIVPTATVIETAFWE
jgi:hypothetical protein